MERTQGSARFEASDAVAGLGDDSRITTVEVELVTETHHVVGHLRTGELRLSDILNLESEDSLLLSDVQATPLDGTVAIPLTKDLAYINKDGIVFGIPREPSSTPEERQQLRSFPYTERSRHQVVMVLPRFTITGYIHLVRTSNIRTALRSLDRTFVPFSEATVAYVARSGVGWRAPVIIVNRRRGQILWSAENP